MVALAALALLAGCAGSPADNNEGTSASAQRLADLRAAADLPPCPAGLGRSLPAATLPCLSGGADVTLNKGGTGRPTLVNVWATWCRPCVREVPLLVDLAADAADKVSVVGVLTQDTPTNGLEFAREFDMNYTSLLDDDGTILRRFASGPPVTLFVSADGEIRHVKRGEFKSRNQLQQLLAKHLGVDLATQR